MSLVPCKCTSCGSNLTVDSAKDAAICEFCGSAFVVEKAINNYNVTNNISAQVVNVYDKPEDFVVRAGELVQYNGDEVDVVIPNNVTHIGRRVFKKCIGLKSVKIPDSVVCIGEEAFLGCEGLTEIYIPDSVTEIKEGAFKECNNIVSVRLSEKLQFIDQEVFCDCDELVSIELPDSIKSLRPSAFDGCGSLAKIKFSKNLDYISSKVFHFCFSLKQVDLPDTVERIYGYVSSEYYSDTEFEGAFCNSGLEEFCVPKKLTKLEPFTFNGCGNLKKVVIHDGVSEISSDTFKDCNNLAEIVASEEWKRTHWDAHPLLYSYKPEDVVVQDEYPEVRQGCYIATAVYGSYDCPQVWILRRFRDYTLDKSFAGRLFIKLYYAVSPTLVKWFGNKEWFRLLWSRPLDRLVRTLLNKGYEDTPYDDLH